MLKAILRSAAVQWTLGVILAGYMALVRRTTRWEVVGLENIEPIWAARKGVIGCVWHARILMTIAGWPKGVQPAAILISRSRDGEFVARAASTLGFGVIRGSSRNARKSKQKGGVAAFRGMIAHVESGGCLAVTPDGPRGPRMRAKAGAVKLAQSTQAPMLAFAWSTNHRVVFKSWDRFVLPFPFGRGVIVWKGPIAPPAADADKAELEAVRVTLENAMIAANQEADRRAGVAVIEPAPHEKSATSDTAEIADAGEAAAALETGDGEAPMAERPV